MSNVSAIGLQKVSISNLGNAQSTLANLSEQLSSGVKSNNLNDYTNTESKKLLDLNSSLERKETYRDVTNLVATRISVCDSVLTGLESVAAQAVSLCSIQSAYNSDSNGSTSVTFESYLSDVEYYLNQKCADRYVFSGTRYSSAPVVDLSTMATLSTSSSVSITTDPVLPEYDTDYTGAASTSAASYVKDNVSVDTTTKLTYGISSNDSSFQELILGLRYAFAATQTSDKADYASLMASAKNYVQKGLTDIQAVHAGLSADATTLGTVQTRLSSDVANVQAQISDIQSVDTNEVSVKITSKENQLEAAYSATAKLFDLSIVKYL